MSDFDAYSWEEAMREALPASHYIEPRDIDDYLAEYSPEIEHAWELAPTGDMSEGMIEHFIDMLERMSDSYDSDMWERIFEDMGEDFWEWYRGNY